MPIDVSQHREVVGKHYIKYQVNACKKIKLPAQNKVNAGNVPDSISAFTSQLVNIVNTLKHLQVSGARNRHFKRGAFTSSLHLMILLSQIQPSVCTNPFQEMAPGNKDSSELFLSGNNHTFSMHSDSHPPYTKSDRHIENVKKDVMNKPARLLYPSQEPQRVYREQHRLLRRLLKINHLLPDKNLKLSRVNNLVHFLSEGKREKRTATVVRLLLKPTGLYGSGKKEPVPARRRMHVITEYLNHEILGMPLDEWSIRQIQAFKSHEISIFHHGHLQRQLFKRINSSTNKGVLTPQARIYYQDNVLKNFLPTIMLQLSEEERNELQKMDITHPRWGLLHAGAMLLSESGEKLQGLTLGDIEEVGIMLDTLLRQGAVPQEYIGYFKLPALLHDARFATGTLDLSAMTEKKMQQIYRRYVDFNQRWIKDHNPLVRLPDLVHGWKSRTGLAKEILDNHFDTYPEEWVNQYLNAHGDFTVADVKSDITFRNVDRIFDQQNRQLADTVYDVEKLLLPAVFGLLSDEEQLFIQQARVERVGAEFNARESLYNVPLPPAARMGMEHSSALVYPIPDRIDLIRCILNREERIYALDVSSANGEYRLNRVDRDRQAMLWLLDDFSMINRSYKLKINSPVLLKEKEAAPQNLIENLAGLHRKKLLAGLQQKGYDKTIQEKISDFFLSFIPFYTCISESIKGNEQEAIPACIADVASLVPFAAQVAYTGWRFSVALGTAATTAVRYGARQATFNAMLRQTGKEFINLYPSIAKEISPKVMGKLGIGFLRNLDPGFELLLSGGANGLLALEKITTKIKVKGAGLAHLSEALASKNALQATSTPLKIHTRSLFSPLNNKMLDVAVVGVKEGRNILAQVNRETGELFGKKFICNAAGDLEPLAVMLQRRRYPLKTAKTKGQPGSSSDKSNNEIIKPEFSYHEKEFNNPSLLKQVAGIQTITKANNLQVVKKSVGSHYIQYYTKTPKSPENVDTLVVSAHGGFIDSDTTAPVVVLPSDITIKMLTPHGTYLHDPGLESVVNEGKNLKSYVTFRDGEINDIEFVPQNSQAEWLFPDNYDPRDIINLQGRKEGLQNYRHYRYEGESEEHISKVLIKNRELAKRGEAQLSDVITVSNKINEISETSLQVASVQKIIDLDREGKLVNEKGLRYKTIVFSHCRNNFQLPEQTLSTYYMAPYTDNGIVKAPKGLPPNRVILTTLHRNDINQEFEKSFLSMGDFLFCPVTFSPQDISSNRKKVQSQTHKADSAAKIFNQSSASAFQQAGNAALVKKNQIQERFHNMLRD